METTIEELLTAGLFHCSVCEQLLTPPVWLTSDNSNVCNNCYQQWPEPFSSALQNIPFTGIFEKLLFPCPYRNEGCEKTLPHHDYQKHVRGCPHAIQTCLLTGCQWSGATKKLMLHLCDAHPDIVLDDRDGVFPLELGDEETEAINVVQTNARLITRIKVNVEKVQVAIFNFDHDLKHNVGEFALEYASDSDVSARHRCNISDDIGSLQTFAAASWTEIIPLARFEVSSLKLCKIGGKRPAISQELLSYVTCFHCNRYLRKPFLECTLGHYTCDTCFKQADCTKCNAPQVRIEEADTLLYCQQCNASISQCYEDVWDFRQEVYLCASCNNVRQARTDARYYTYIRSRNVYDTLLGRFSFPCRFEGRGCKFTGPCLEKHRRHEKACEYRTLSCPQDDCGRALRYSEMMLHLRTDHREVCVATDTHYFIQKLRTGTNGFRFFLVCHDRLFVHRFNLLSHRKYVYGYEWDVREIQDCGSDDFVFTISMEGRTGQMLSWQHSCGSKMTLQADSVKGFVEHEELLYFLKVAKTSDSK